MRNTVTTSVVVGLLVCIVVAVSIAKYVSAPDGCVEIASLTSGAIKLPKSELSKAEGMVNKAMALAAEERVRPIFAARLIIRSANEAYAKDRSNLAELLAEGALPLLRKRLPGSLDVAACLNTLGVLADERGQDADRQSEAQDYADAARIDDGATPTFVRAETLIGLGNVAEDAMEYARAENKYDRALRIATRLNPTSDDVARSLIDLGNVWRLKGDIAPGVEKRDDWKRGGDYDDAAIRILRSHHPDSSLIAPCLNNRGLVSLAFGDLIGARASFKAALTAREALYPNGEPVAQSWNNIGLVDSDMGDLASAEDDYQRALSIDESLEPPPPDLAAIHSNLGSLDFDRGDLESAESHYLKALQIDRRVEKQSLAVEADLANLGHLLEEKAKSRNRARTQILNQAHEYLTEALFAPTAQLSDYLGELWRERGDLPSALARFREAAEFQSAINASSLEEATFLGNEANVEVAMGRLLDAEKHYGSALEITSKWPNSINNARLLNDRGTLAFTQHKHSRARQLYERAYKIIEKQRSEVRDLEGRRKLVEENEAIVENLIEVDVASHNFREALNASESLRGLSLAESIGELHHREFLRSASPDLRKLLAHYDTLANELSKAAQATASLGMDSESNAFVQAQQQVRSIGQSETESENDIRRTAPRYADLAFPPKFQVPAVRQTDSGKFTLLDKTLLMEYEICAENSYLFTTTAAGKVRCYTIKISQAELEKDVDAVVSADSDPRAPAPPKASITLFALLVRPAGREVRQAKHLLISPTKFLWKLPFCALIDNGDSMHPHYLIESKPIHMTVSMNVYAQLRRNRRTIPSRQNVFVGFGNPAYRAVAASSNHWVAPSRSSGSRTLGVGRAASPETTSFPPIPITGPEIGAIASLFVAPRPFVEGEATRTKVLTAAQAADQLMFAVHAEWSRKGDPLLSYLALTPENETDTAGILTAIDVMENLQLHAELVTLAGCSTGAGQVTESEGVIGLTRAFLYAGAQSVVSTLWKVLDGSSARFMSGIDPLEPLSKPSKADLVHSFYGAYLAGATKDVALQTAQVSMIHDPKWPAYQGPYYWAAYTLQGDWR